MNKQEIGYMDIMYELTAMSVICPKLKGYGFVIYVYSNDHTPPHIHISEDLNTKDIAKVAITNETPRKKKDLVILDGSLTGAQKAALVQWANSPYVKGVNLSNWDNAKTVWIYNHGGKKCKFMPIRIKIVED